MAQTHAEVGRRVADGLTRRIAGHVLGWLRPQAAIAAGRTRDGVRRAELDGLGFAFRARVFAIAVVSAWLLVSVAWPRNLYYLAIAAGFFLLGYLPYRLRRHRLAGPIKLAFVVLDVALMTAAILMPPPFGLSADWPVQMRLRGQEFLYIVLLLAESALTYSPLMVLWTGAVIAAVWSLGVHTIYMLPDTLRFSDAAARSGDGSMMRMFLNPTFVGLTPWTTQVIATALFAVIVALAVWRGRQTLLAQCRAEVVRADLARYVSPDVADALAAKVNHGAAHDGFGPPATRTVAVLFADIVGFTALAETLPPERTFALLRDVHQRGCGAVFRHGGTLDKYLGDGFMATFGALGDEPDAAARALACAFALQDEAARWNAARARAGEAPLRLSVGLHCGPVVVGDLGAERRVEFTVVGDVVNVASRLEHATREVGAGILVSDACLAAAGGEPPGRPFTGRREIALRGRARPILAHAA
ncbi:adenylate/guanylate cyclase domain-containing protein [Methylobacterium sp. NEAU 140]|uniref:adenylate/guanylate cyclase domain-containing protein n=1 Tax=Methylobacterium sp. NEAU 140 TaxID=3064945 RepID=UPI002735E7F1|nr:adenylate/guanylate cyclase domain-containing protein [Methylobacterium sp. NEAU 140]MDP4026229.1 adenylate/guanylate cyclase domain-containing protein [Methylobacterium sp. NEAU 140]